MTIHWKPVEQYLALSGVKGLWSNNLCKVAFGFDSQSEMLGDTEFSNF